MAWYGMVWYGKIILSMACGYSKIEARDAEQNTEIHFQFQPSQPYMVWYGMVWYGIVW